jgi:hypothetical protein
MYRGPSRLAGCDAKNFADAMAGDKKTTALFRRQVTADEGDYFHQSNEAFPKLMGGSKSHGVSSALEFADYAEK